MADGFFPELVSATQDPNTVTNPIFVELTDGTNPVTSFTVTQATGSNLHVTVDAGSAVIGHVITDTGSTTAVTGNVTVVQGTGSNLHVQVDTLPSIPAGTNVIGHVITDSGSTTVVTGTVDENLTQVGGSAIALGQAVMASSLPVVIASDQTPLPISLSISSVAGAVHDYATVTQGATSSANHDYTVVTSMKLTEVSFSSSGAGKVELKVGPVASLVSKWVGFVDKTGGTVTIVLDPPITIPTTSTGTVRLIVTNRENQSQDLYSTIIGVDA